METLTFRPTRRQLLNMTLLTVGIALVSATAVLSHYAAGANLPALFAALGIAATVCAPLTGWILYKSARSFTVCDQSGIQSQGYAREWHCSWAYVREIAIRYGSRRTRTVVVVTVSGDLLQLGTPATGGVMADPDFEAKVRQLRAYWRTATGAPADAEPSASIPLVARRPPPPVPTRLVIRWIVGLILVGAVITVPFTASASGPAVFARLGYGQPGYYTAVGYACDTKCYWVGDFRALDSSQSRTSAVMAPGSGLARPGQRVLAVSEGHGSPIYPAAGGLDWLPFGLPLIVIIGCLPFVLGWIVQGRRSRRTLPVVEYEPADARPQPRHRALSDARFGLVIGVEVVALTLGCSFAGYRASLVPLSPSPTALACADYRAWALAQHNGGPPSRDPALLAEALRTAPAGRLASDLTALQSDVARAVAPQATQLALGSDMIVLSDMKPLITDCTA